MRFGAPRPSIRLFQGNSLPWGGLMPKGDEVMEVRKLKTVIAGCGKIFPMHAVPVSRDPHAVLTAVCDVKPGACRGCGGALRLPGVYGF